MLLKIELMLRSISEMLISMRKKESSTHQTQEENNETLSVRNYGEDSELITIKTSK